MSISMLVCQWKALIFLLARQKHLQEPQVVIASATVTSLTSGRYANNPYIISQALLSCQGFYDCFMNVVAPFL